MKRLLLAATLAISLSAPVFADDGGMTQNPKDIKAGTYMLNKDHGKITWAVNHLGFSTYMGQFTDVTAKLAIDPMAPERTLLTASVETDSIHSLNDKLDDELKSDAWLDCDKNPTANFVSTRVEITGNKAKVIGNLTLNGVTKPEEMDVTFNQAGINPIINKYEIGFSGTMTIKRSDFGITKYVPMVGDDVALTIEGEFTQG